MNNGTMQNVNYDYQYQNNRLMSVTDNLGNTRTMSYDATGNLLTDSKRGIENMVYGRSNLPSAFSVTRDGNTTSVSYLYSINDNRIYKKTDNTEEFSIEAGGKTIAVYDMVKDDIDWFVFGTERLAKLKYTPEGGWNFNGQAANTLGTKADKDPFEIPLDNRGAFVFQADFYLYDHLGNSRVTYRAETKDCKEGFSYTVSYAADYYPYGKILREYKPEKGKAERYLTTQHERDVESGLDYRGARFYDSDLGRFLSLDPMATKFPAWSAYNYVLGNPIKYIDPNGKAPQTDYYNTNGKLVKHVDDDTNDKKLVLIDSKKAEKVDEAIKGGAVIDVPSNEVVKNMENAFNETEKNGLEHGFYVGNKGTISKTVEGTSGEINNKEWTVARNDLTSKDDLISYDVHTHPLKKDAEGNITEKGLPEPSPTDKGNIVGNKPNVVLGYDVINIPPPSGTIGGSYTQKPVRQIGFYNAQGNINKNSINFDDFKSAVNKINK